MVQSLRQSTVNNKTYSTLSATDSIFQKTQLLLYDIIDLIFATFTQFWLDLQRKQSGPRYCKDGMSSEIADQWHKYRQVDVHIGKQNI